MRIEKIVDEKKWPLGVPALVFLASLDAFAGNLPSRITGVLPSNCNAHVKKIREEVPSYIKQAQDSMAAYTSKSTLFDDANANGCSGFFQSGSRDSQVAIADMNNSVRLLEAVRAYLKRARDEVVYIRSRYRRNAEVVRTCNFVLTGESAEDSLGLLQQQSYVNTSINNAMVDRRVFHATLAANKDNSASCGALPGALDGSGQEFRIANTGADGKALPSLDAADGDKKQYLQSVFENSAMRRGADANAQALIKNCAPGDNSCLAASLAIMRNETDMGSNRDSSGGNFGVMQVTPDTCAEVTRRTVMCSGSALASSDTFNISVGTRRFQQYCSPDTPIEYCFGSYNAGPRSWAVNRGVRYDTNGGGYLMGGAVNNYVTLASENYMRNLAQLNSITSMNRSLASFGSAK